MTGARDQRLHLSIEAAADAVFDLGPDDVGDPSGAEPQVRELQRIAADRASGVRRYETTVDGWVLEVAVEPAARAILRQRAGQSSQREGRAVSDIVKAQIPGRVVRLWVAEGDTVEAGQRLLAIEAMKMENEVRAPRAGTVASIRTAADSSVELGDELLTVR